MMITKNDLIAVYVSKYLGKDKEKGGYKFGTEHIWQMTKQGHKVQKEHGSLVPVSLYSDVMDKIPQDGRYIITSGFKFRLVHPEIKGTPKSEEVPRPQQARELQEAPELQEARELLKLSLYAFNQIPSTAIGDGNNTKTYDIASKISKFLKTKGRAQ